MFCTRSAPFSSVVTGSVCCNVGTAPVCALTSGCPFLPFAAVDREASVKGIAVEASDDLR